MPVSPTARPVRSPRPAGRSPGPSAVKPGGRPPAGGMVRGPGFAGDPGPTGPRPSARRGATAAGPARPTQPRPAPAGPAAVGFGWDGGPNNQVVCVALATDWRSDHRGSASLRRWSRGPFPYDPPPNLRLIRYPDASGQRPSHRIVEYPESLSRKGDRVFLRRIPPLWLVRFLGRSRCGARIAAGIP